MARQTKKQQVRQKQSALLLLAVIGLALLGAGLQAIPGFQEGLYRMLGISVQPKAVPDTGVSSPTGVHFIDVGQGDAVLVEQDGEFALIDAGPPESSEQLLGYLSAAGVDQLRYLFMSHPHVDHIGGMRAVVQSLPVGQVLLPDLGKASEPTTSAFIELLQSLLDHEVSANMVKQGERYPLGSGEIRVLQAGIETENFNIISSILLFEGGGVRFLTSGDAEKPNEIGLMKSGEDFGANLFKAGHHGSDTSNTLDFLRVVQPDLVVVCCGLGNPYGHPTRIAMEHFEQVGAVVLRTDLQGSVVVRPTQEGQLAYAVERQPAA